MSRNQALVHLRVAGYHADSATFARVYVEARISYPAAMAEWRRGAAQRAAGVPCACHECAQASQPAVSHA